MIRWILAISLLGLAAAQAQPKQPTVLVAAARTEPFADRIEALGTLAANESVDLTAKVTETITSLDFTDGQRVKKGDILATMHAEEARALLVEAESNTEESRRQFDRTKQLSTSGAASTAQLDEARRAYETARARQLAIQSRINELTIEAPFDGVVGLRNISVGAVVRPASATLSEPVKVSTMIKPKRISAMRSWGSRTRKLCRGLTGFMRCPGILPVQVRTRPAWQRSWRTVRYPDEPSDRGEQY